jgi:2-iminobutanoate/2-iminopropanoate deaminase
MNIQRRNYPALGEAVGPYVHAVRHGDTLYLSGLTAFGTSAQSGKIEIQAREIFRQIAEIAKAEGSGLDNLIKITTFVTELDRIEALRHTLFDICGANLPASSLIHVAGLFAAGLNIEIEAIIAVEDSVAITRSPHHS